MELASKEYLRVPHIVPLAGIMHKGKVVSVPIIVNIREQQRFPVKPDQ